jgi:hypothetical protein
VKVHVHKGGKRHRHYRCVKPRRRRRAVLPAPQPPVPPQPPQPPGPPAPLPDVINGVRVYRGPFGVEQAERLLWRAGFGPAPGEAHALAALGLDAAVQSLTRPSGPEILTGPEPKAVNGGPLFPADADGHDHLWWLDRMARTNRPLVERMALIWHDWFATSGAAITPYRLMLDQNELFRRSALGSFRQLLLDVTKDPAMLLWLNGYRNIGRKPDENYARELMELFSLGADRGAYTEQDVREMARALTGWGATENGELGFHDFRFIPTNHDSREKVIFGQRGNFDWTDACRLCSDHPLHPSYVVDKLWGYFIPTPPDAGTRQALEDLYRASGHVVLPLVEAILMHPDLYTGQRMVKPPVVYAAGLVRARRAGISGDGLFTWCEVAGQRLFRPPNVSGWDHTRWLDTTTVRARWLIVNTIHQDWIRVTSAEGLSYDPHETAAQALTRARAFWNNPSMTDATRVALERWGERCLMPTLTLAGEARARVGRQNALRHLVAVSPDLQVC